MRLILSRWIGGAVALLASVAAAQPPVVLNFDDIPVPDPASGTFVPAEYGGLNWGDAIGNSLFFVENDLDYTKIPANPTDSGYGNTYGAPSAPNAIANDHGAAVRTVSSASPFNFVGADFSSFAGFNVIQSTSATTLTITGSRLGVPVGTTTVTLDPTAYHFATANFQNVDTLTFNASGGLVTDLLGDLVPGGFFLMDDFTYAPEIPGDTNDDGKVDFTDLITVARNYGQSGTWETGDFNNDGTVGFDDLVILARNYGPNAAVAATASGISDESVPEPGALGSVAIASAAFLFRRRRALPGGRSSTRSPVATLRRRK